MPRNTTAFAVEQNQKLVWKTSIDIASEKYNL